MAYKHVKIPAGEKIAMGGNAELQVPDNPIIPFIEGDGTGPDIWKASVRVFDAAIEKAYRGRKKIAWMEVYAGEKSFNMGLGWLPDETVEAYKEFLVGIKGPLTTPIGGGFRSLNVTLRQVLDLYACIRPVRYYTGVPSPMKAPELIDMVIFRENTEDVYAGIEWEATSPEAQKLINFLNTELGCSLDPTAAIGIKPMTERCSKRLIRMALKYGPRQLRFVNDVTMSARAGETTRTRIFDVVRGYAWPPGYTGRALRNRFLERWEGHDADLAASQEERKRFQAAQAE